MIIEQIKKFWAILRHEEETELRAINPETKERRTYHFSNEEQLVNLCKNLNSKCNLYLGVNERIKGGTKAEDVKEVKVIPIDIDCVHKPAIDNDIVEAMEVTTKIIEDAQKQGFSKPAIAFSGNGYQLFFCIPGIKITKSNKQDVEEKIKEFENRLIEKYSTEKVKLDQVGDLPRIMRIPGTFNLKSKTTSKFIDDNYEEDGYLQQHILDIKPSKNIILGGISEELKQKIQNNKDINNLYEAESTALKKFKSRSEAELSLLSKLVGLGLNKEQIFSIMGSCKIGKWQEANIQYRDRTYQKAITLISKERLSQTDNPTLNDLYLVYKKWLYLEDTKRIDVVLATYLTKYMKGTPIWLIIVGNSGDGKTEQVKALENMEGFFIMHNLTPKALVSGSKDVEDLAPKLDNKFLVIPDMAQILQLHPQEKGSLWAQLRDLYDGYAGKDSGTGKSSRYKDIRVTMVACSTPKIDSQILVHQDLGTRELIYRTEDTKDKMSLMMYAMDNENHEEQMRKEIKQITNKFMENKRPIQRELDDDEQKKLMNIALFITKVRAAAEIDSYTNELRNIVYPEQPTRIVKQLKRLYMALISLEDNYPQERAFQILWHLAKSCAFPVRINIFEYFIRNYINLKHDEEYSTSKIANDLCIGKKTAQRELNVIWNMGIINKRESFEGNRFLPTDYWKLNLNNEFIKDYIESFKVPQEIGVGRN